MRLALAGFLDLAFPGAGHALVGRWRSALVFAVPVLALLVAGLGMYLTSGTTGLLAFVVTPGVLPALALLNLALGAWRIAAVVDLLRRGAMRPGLPNLALVAGAVLVLVVAPHAWAGMTISAVNDTLDSIFAPEGDNTAEPTDDPNLTLPPWAYEPTPTDGGDAVDTTPPSLAPGVTPVPRPTGPFSPGVGTLPPLGAATPWQKPGAVPWGDDGRFDLLLLGSDAGPDRWSRRMDVMLLVEVDVATGKVAMIGLPRNLIDSPFPPGSPAYASSACHCFTNLLNAMYVEATVYHPGQWPGTGPVKGIGAVRSMVSTLTGRPIDAVLVADLWGVIKVVDAMGGVDIDIPAAVSDDNYPDPVWGHIHMSLPAGQQHLDGRHALFYARSRHQDSDYSRMLRQQTLLLAIRNDIGPGTILDAPALAAAAKGFVWTDLPRDSLPNLVNLFGKAASASVKQLRIVPPTYPEVLTKAEITKIRADIAKLLGLPPPPPSPTPAPTPTGPTPEPSPPPSDVPSSELSQSP